MSNNLSENPFASPQTAADEGSPFRTQEGPIEYDFEDASGRASAAIWCLRIMIGLSLVGIVSCIMQLSLLDRIALGTATQPEIEGNDLRQQGIGILTLVALLATGICFCRWIVRSHKNIRSFTDGPFKFTPGWAAGYFFVPILNLIRPYEAMGELWRSSAPSKAHLSAGIGVWWAAWIVNNIFGQISSRFMLDAEQISEIRLASIFEIMDNSISIIAAWLAILVVRRISNAQTDTATELGLLRRDESV